MSHAPGIEFIRNDDCHQWVIRNHSLEAVLYRLPASREVVSIPVGRGLLMVMDKTLTFALQWTDFELKRGPDYPEEPAE